jgi:hypothetical protein
MDEPIRRTRHAAEYEESNNSMSNNSNPDYKRGYASGYSAGVRGIWSTHRPPEPPNEIVRELMEAARKLRDKADAYCATLPNDDEMRADFEPLIDGIDEAFMRISEWLTKTDLPQKS